MEIGPGKKMKLTMTTSYEPFSATKLWNLHIKLFKKTITCKTHRRKIRYYNNCFTSADAVNSMHNIMNLLSEKNINKEQAKTMIKKLLLFSVIEDVKGRCGTDNVDIEGELFRIRNYDETTETISLCSAVQSSHTPKQYYKIKQHIKNKITSPMISNDKFFSPARLRRFSVNDSYKKSYFRNSAKTNSLIIPSS